MSIFTNIRDLGRAELSIVMKFNNFTNLISTCYLTYVICTSDVMLLTIVDVTEEENRFTFRQLL
jgi:hypothetical protein